MNILKLVLAAIVAIVALSFAGGSFYTVDEGERAVIVTQGKIVGVAQPGFHWKAPFITDAHVISVRTQALEFKNEPVYTADRQTAQVTFSVNYSAIPTDQEVITLYRTFQTLEGIESRAIVRQSREQIKNVFGTFTADTAIRERARLNTEVAKAIAGVGEGLVKVEGVNIENIDFSDAVEQAAEQRAQAEMLVQTEKQKLERTKVEADIQTTQAQAEADSNLARAKADAEGVRLKGEAEAAAIKAKSDALQQSPNLVELTKAERWDGKLPTTFVPGSALPLLNIK
ncbi:prohibitin family protein [Rhizobium lusitanum]|uniref:Prohibitin family protein n=1 Tax=Rhizobium lusitanum TaxID=293958 RepID=A0A6L9U6F3_9HYPH|nr:prohibitin family protein [Rhizobium lusitanum]NEI70989.1 prohibitin family protein [Rhizobium lusitanum]